MENHLQRKLRIPDVNLNEINGLLLDPDNHVIQDFLDVVRKYGTPEEINFKAEAARHLPSLLRRLEEAGSPYLADLHWLMDQRDCGAFVSVPEFRRQVLGPAADERSFADDFAVTLEISAFQYFPWLIAEARRAIAERELMPGRFIRVRKMKESEADDGDLLAVAAATASRSPSSASDSFILRTRMKRPGINSPLAMACFASAISQGKY